MLRIAITDRQTALTLDRPALRRIVRDVLANEGVSAGDISLAFVDDAEMQALNRRHLGHDYPTDVLSFLLHEDAASQGGRSLEAEIVVSTETARREASQFGWRADAEIMLYIVHGLLHACGYDDRSRLEKARMRRAERAALRRAGLEPRYESRKRRVR
jgi:probable rRNA maturation factor